MNSTKLLCAEPCGDFFVNLRLKQLEQKKTLVKSEGMRQNCLQTKMTSS
jgi:hypothetical protein